MKKLSYLLVGVFLLSLLISVPLLSQQAPRARVPRQPGQGLEQALANLETVLDKLGLTASQKETAKRIARERAEAFIKFASAQASLARLARDIRNGLQVSDEEANKALKNYFSEQKKYFETLKSTEKELRSLPPKAQVVILAPGFAGGARAGRMGQGPMGKGPMGR